MERASWLRLLAQSKWWKTGHFARAQDDVFKYLVLSDQPKDIKLAFTKDQEEP